MKYSNNLEYLIAAVGYLGMHQEWWSRTPSKMAAELGLDERHLTKVLRAFPGWFRRSAGKNPGGEHYFSLQARYAQRTQYAQDESSSTIPPIPEERLRTLLDILSKNADRERSSRNTALTAGVAATAAILSAAVATYVTFAKTQGPTASPVAIHLTIE